MERKTEVVKLYKCSLVPRPPLTAFFTGARGDLGTKLIYMHVETRLIYEIENKWRCGKGAVSI